jgi:P-type conjugative transfer protein TrbJ
MENKTQKPKINMAVGMALMLSLYLSCISDVAFAFVPCLFKIDTLNQGLGENTSGFCAALQAGEIATASEVMVSNQEIGLLKQAEQVAQEILTVQNLVIQTEQLMKDIEENPLQVIVPDVDQIIRNQERINQLAQNIDKNSSKVGDNLIKDLYHPDTIGLGSGSKFELWSQTRAAALQETYTTVKAFLKGFKGENASFEQAVKNIRATKGQRQTAKSAGEISAQQLGRLAKIEELLMNLLNLQAADQGAKLQEEADARAIEKGIIENGLGPKFKVPKDVFIGPGSLNSKAF